MPELTSVELIAGYDADIGYSAALAMNGLLTAHRVTYAQMKAEIDSGDEKEMGIDPKVRAAFAQYESAANTFLGHSEANDTLSARQRHSNMAASTEPVQFEVATRASLDSLLTDSQLEAQARNQQELHKAVEAMIEPVVNAFRDKLPGQQKQTGNGWLRKKPRTISFEVPNEGLQQIITMVSNTRHWGFSRISTGFLSVDNTGKTTSELGVSLDNFTDNQYPERISVTWFGRYFRPYPEVENVLLRSELGKLVRATGYTNHLGVSELIFDQSGNRLTIASLNPRDNTSYAYDFDSKRNIFVGRDESGRELPWVSARQYLTAIDSALSIFPLIERPQNAV